MALPLHRRIALDLFRWKRAVDTRLHDLTYLFWECTLRCNCSCLHCGSDCLRDAAHPDMPLEDFLRVIDSISSHLDPNKCIIACTGGEPLMRDDLAQCGRALADRGFPWGMVTNAFALNRARFESLLDAGLRSISISLDGLRPSHDWFRGRRGSHDKALRAIELAARIEGLTFDVVTCVHQRNIRELPSMKKKLVELGVRRWRPLLVFPKGRAAGNNLLSLKPDQLRDLMEFIVKTRQEGKILASCTCEGFLGDYEGRVSDGFFTCHAGVNIGSVLVDGSISACPSLRSDYIQGNIYTDDFWDVWTNRFGIMRNRRWTRTGDCASCRVYKWCHGGPLHLRDESTGELLACNYGLLHRSP